MRNYVITDSLNPNAVNPRYGRPASQIGVQEAAYFFTASNDREAVIIAMEAVDAGHAGYSERQHDRVKPTLWRTKEWYGARRRIVFTAF